MTDYPGILVPVNHVEPVLVASGLSWAARWSSTRPRPVRVGMAGLPAVLHPLADVRRGCPGRRGRDRGDPAGRRAGIYGVAGRRRPAAPAAKVLVTATVEGLDDTVRFEWSALDAWFEEDEQVFVHPRDPYTRVDALRSTRTVRVESNGVVLAESSSPVMVFETGLPTRYYLNRTDVDFAHLVSSDTVTECPYKGTTSGYWYGQVGGVTHPDIAWTYDFPTRELLPIAGLIAFYNEKVDIFLDGAEAGAAAGTHFSGSNH